MINKIKLLKKLDTLVGPSAVLFAKVLISPRPLSGKTPQSILIIRPGGMGDAVLLIPTISSLIKRFPHTRVDILAEKRNCEVFSFCPEINNVLLYDNPSQLICAVRGKYDIVIDSEQWYRLSSIIAYLTKSPVRVGFDTNERRRLFTVKTPYNQNDSEINSFYNLISSFSDATLNIKDPFLAIPQVKSKRVKEYLAAMQKKELVALFAGGSVTEKRWGAQKFREVSKILTDKGFNVVVVGGNEDISDGNLIAKDLSNSINLCGKLSLLETAEVLSVASLLITGDSGIMHIAYGLGTKTLALFGPGNPKKWAPIGSRHQYICKNIDCSPCSKFGHTDPCKKDRECMSLITPEEVVKKALTIMKR